MAKIKANVMLPTLIVLAASFLRKKENRQKLKTVWTDLQNKLPLKNTTYQRSFKEFVETAASPQNLKIRENNFISEGGSQTALAYYNENKQKVK